MRKLFGHFLIFGFFGLLLCHAGSVTFSGTGQMVAQYFHKGWYQFAPPVLVGRATNGSISSYITYKDSIYAVTNGATVVTDVQWGSPQSDPNLPTNYPIAFSSGTTNVTAPTTNYTWTFHSPGLYSLTATSADQTNTVTGTVNSTTSSASTNFYYPQTNSVNYTNSFAIDALIAGKTAGSTTQARFSAISASQTNMMANTFTPNTNLFSKTVDMTCVAAYCDNRGLGAAPTKFLPTVISPRHAIGPAHAPQPTGAIVNFVDSTGATVTRTIISGKTAADDIYIYCLNTDLPSTVTPAKLLPSTFANYLSLQYATAQNPMAVPVLVPNQTGQIEVGEANLLTTGSTPQISYQRPSTVNRIAFDNWLLVSGDSGFTAGMVIAGAYVPISEFHYGGYGSGPFLSAYLTQINSAMSALSTAAGLTSGETTNGGPYQVSTVNLSSYGTF